MYVKGFLCKMAENMQADEVLRRQPLVFRCDLYILTRFVACVQQEIYVRLYVRAHCALSEVAVKKSLGAVVQAPASRTEYRKSVILCSKLGGFFADKIVYPFIALLPVCKP